MIKAKKTAEAGIHYSIVPLDAAAHVFEVRCRVKKPDSKGQLFRMPAWIPGSYLIRDFSRHVLAFDARCGGESVAVGKEDKSTWRCAPCAGELEVRYEVYAWDLSVRGAHLDRTHAYFNGPCVFFAVVGQEDQRCTVNLMLPPGKDFEGWEVATTMRRDGADVGQLGLYQADDYDELIDHPVEIGRLQRVSFDAVGVPHEFAIYGRQQADLERLAADSARICTQHHALFGSPPPIDRYLFLVTALGEGYGGLEHRWSSSLMCRRDDLPAAGVKEISKEYRRFLGLVSHEYFHLWNVKRIRPAVFSPYELTQEHHTELLWVFEGITSYYDDLALVRSGVIDVSSYLELLGQTITRVWQTPGRSRMSLAESSFDAWTKLYKADENAPNALISYYTKGALAALALDLLIRRESNGDKSLDDVMRALWQRHGDSGNGSEGVAEDGFEKLAAEVSGVALSEFFDRAVRSRDDLPLADLLSWAGVQFELQPQPLDADPTAGPGIYVPEIGARVTADNGVLLKHVLQGGPASRAGLSAGDQLIALDGLRCDAGQLRKFLTRYRGGARITAHAFRRDELLQLDLTIAEAPADHCVLQLADDVTDTVLARRSAWLNVKA